MELNEFVIFLSIMTFLFCLSLIRRGILFSILGIIITLTVFPLCLQGVIIERAYVVNSSSGNLTTYPTYANSTLVVLIMLVIFLLFVISAIRGGR